jgi:hypothetical protein
MRRFLPVLVLLAACSSTPESEALPAVPSPEQARAQLGATALAFSEAMEVGDLQAGWDLASEGARPFFAAELEFRTLLLEEEERDGAEPVVELVSAEADGDKAVAVVNIKASDSSKDGEDMQRVLHLEFDGRRWGVFGFSRDVDDEARTFAAMTSRVLERIERARAETTPHPELGPLVEAYLAAAGALDQAGMLALMTPECASAESEREHGFTSGFLAGRFKVAKWQFANHEVEGDAASQRVRTILSLADGGTDGEPMTFNFERADGAWKLAGIN